MQITETRIHVKIDVTGAPILAIEGERAIFPTVVKVMLLSKTPDYAGVDVEGPKVKADGTASKLIYSPYLSTQAQSELLWLVEAIEMAKAYAAGRGA
jgi:hypothetical protein